MQAQTYRDEFVANPNLESNRSGVSWGAVFAGGVAAAGITLILLVVGAGLGFSSISPWAGESMSATGLAVAAGIWLVIVQWLSSIVGGYVAGRLRTKWADHHSDEVFFRDTAHGFLAWGVATILMVGFTVYAGAGAVSGVASTVGGAASTAAESPASAYALDQLFRANPGAAPATATATTAAQPAAGAQPNEDVAASRAEAGRILGRAVTGTGDDADQAYLAQLVSQKTGLTPDEAKQRVDQVVASAKDAADKARKASAYASIITALTLMVGIAAVGGALGGATATSFPPFPSDPIQRQQAADRKVGGASFVSRRPRP
jgi:hypothetical protein